MQTHSLRIKGVDEDRDQSLCIHVYLIYYSQAHFHACDDSYMKLGLVNMKTLAKVDHMRSSKSE